jgi:hypothetical protein
MHINVYCFAVSSALHGKGQSIYTYIQRGRLWCVPDTLGSFLKGTKTIEHISDDE